VYSYREGRLETPAHLCVPENTHFDARPQLFQPLRLDQLVLLEMGIVAGDIVLRSTQGSQ
jgi:hypothetical protein